MYKIERESEFYTKNGNQQEREHLQKKRICYVRQAGSVGLLLLLLFLFLVFLLFLSLFLVVVFALFFVLLFVRTQRQITVIRFDLTLKIGHLAGPVLAFLLFVLFLERRLCH